MGMELHKDIDNILEEISIFGGMNGLELSELMDYMYEVTIKEGETVYKEGDPPGNLYIVLDGEIDFYMMGELFTKSRVGQTFGISATIGIQKQMVTALVRKEVKLAVISKSFLMKMRKTDKDLFIKVILNISRDLARDLKYMRGYVERRQCTIEKT